MKRVHDPEVNCPEVVDCYPSSGDPETEIDQTTRVADCSYPALQSGAFVADDHGLVAFHVLVGCCTFFVDRVGDPSQVALSCSFLGHHLHDHLSCASAVDFHGLVGYHDLEDCCPVF